jgi:hypothetical protein
MILLENNPDLSNALNSSDPAVRRSASKLMAKIDSCRTTKQLNELADQYPDILFCTPMGESKQAVVYGTQKIRKERL